MELYKGKGGTLLIKVLVNKNKAQLYFAYLGKIQINKLLESINDTQKTKDIKCYKAPKNYKELYSHLRTIYLQANHNLITLEELKDKKGWSFNVIAGPMENNTNLLDWIATNNIDVLVKLEGLSEQFYLSPGPARLYANVDINQAVTVDGVEYPFTKVTFGTNSEGHIISIDNFLKYQYHDFSNDNRQKNKIDITITSISDYVDERLNQLKFLQAIITHRYFCIGNVRLDVAFSELSEEDISSLKSNILFLQKTSDFFEQIHVSNHFNFKGLTKDEYDKLIFLVKLFNDEKPEALPCLEEPYTCFKIGDYNLCFGISKLENIGFRFNDINNCFSSGIYQSGEEMSSAVHSYFFSKNVFPDNLNYSDIVAEITRAKSFLNAPDTNILTGRRAQRNRGLHRKYASQLDSLTDNTYVQSGLIASEEEAKVIFANYRRIEEYNAARIGKQGQRGVYGSENLILYMIDVHNRGLDELEYGLKALDDFDLEQTPEFKELLEERNKVAGISGLFQKGGYYGKLAGLL